MNIVLSILQVLGVVLLVVIVIVVFAMLLLLFCPVRYELEGELQEEKWAKAKVHWFLHLIRFKVSYGDDLLYGEGGIFWKKFSFSKDFTKVETDTTESEVVEDAVGPEVAEEKNDNAQKESMISKIKGMIERIRDIWPKLKKILQDEKNKAAVVHLKDEFVYLIKILLPKKSKVDAAFSTGSPDTTGQLFGLTAMFPITYSRGWSIFPDFEAEGPYFKGSFWGKGKIYGYKLVGIVFRIIFDKKCRRLYNILKRFFEIIKKETNQEVK